MEVDLIGEIIQNRIVRVLISFTRRLNISQAAVNVLVLLAFSVSSKWVHWVRVDRWDC